MLLMQNIYNQSQQKKREKGQNRTKIFFYILLEFICQDVESTFSKTALAMNK
jgi:hypothetical protein